MRKSLDSVPTFIERLLCISCHITFNSLNWPQRAIQESSIDGQGAANSDAPVAKPPPLSEFSFSVSVNGNNRTPSPAYGNEMSTWKQRAS